MSAPTDPFTERVYTPGAVPGLPPPPPPPVLPPPPQEAQRTVISAMTAMPCQARRVFRRMNINETKSRSRESSHKESHRTRWPEGGRTRRPPGTLEEGAVVVTVTVAVAGCMPSIETFEGDTMHEAYAGAPAHEKFTPWLRPPLGVTLREYVAVWPGLTLAYSWGAEIEKS